MSENVYDSGWLPLSEGKKRKGRMGVAVTAPDGEMQVFYYSKGFEAASQEEKRAEQDRITEAIKKFIEEHSNNE